MSIRTSTGTVVLVVGIVVACTGDAPIQPRPVDGPSAQAFPHGEWSTPEILGPAVNSSARELKPALSPDELSLYFGSDRTVAGESFGGIDIWVSRRSCRDCPWEAAQNLGPVINGPGNDGQPFISQDGHLLFFTSSQGPGGFGDDDIYMSRRDDPRDDFAWGPPVNLGPNVNTADFEGGATYLQNVEDGPVNFYFTRGSSVQLPRTFATSVNRAGEATRPAERVEGLSDNPLFTEQSATIRGDGRELIFWSSPARGGLGNTDFWVSTRRSVHEPWSTPENLGAPVNTTATELEGTLSFDGRTLVFSGGNNRGGLGRQDIWISTRRPSGP